MTDVANVRNNWKDIRWKLLTSVSATALLISAYTSGEAQAADNDGDRPLLWIEMGGNFDQLTADHQLFDPPFFSIIPKNYPSQLATQKAPALELDWEAAVSFQPDESDWVFNASIRYGRSHSNRHEHPQTADVIPVIKALVSHYPSAINFLYMPPRFVESQASDSESHVIVDFVAGKDVGLGMFELPGTSILSGGVRYAALTSNSGFGIFTDPDSAYHKTGVKYHSHYDHGSFDAKRSFHGIGPAISWNASTPFMGNAQNGELTFDLGANAAVLFGRQSAAGAHQTAGAYYCGNGYGVFFGRTAPSCPAPTANAASYVHGFRHRLKQISHYQRTPAPFNRSHVVAVPNLGGFIGVSMRYNNAKVSFGYRADEFFGAIDGGIDARKSENRAFFGPFANIRIGLGE